MDKLEELMQEVRKDVSDVAGNLSRLTHSLVGDELREGAISSINNRISKTESEVKSLLEGMEKFEDRLLTDEEYKSLRSILTLTQGWKKTFGIIIWLLPLITLIIDKVLK
jgi:hypothetical protein